MTAQLAQTADGCGQGARDFVQALDRGLAVLRAFDAEHPSLTLSQVAQAIGINRASARRFLQTLVELGYVNVAGKQFALRPKVLELGHGFLSGLSLPDVARPHVQRLVDRLNESSSMSILDREEVVVVARVATWRILQVAIPVGTRLPATVTAMGRVLLAAQPDAWLDSYLATAALRRITPCTICDAKQLGAELGRVRGQGYAIVDQELEEGLRSIAVPIRDQLGQVVAAIDVSTHASRGTLASMRKAMLGPLRDTAAAIGEDSLAVLLRPHSPARRSFSPRQANRSCAT